MKNRHDRLFVINLDAAWNSVESFQAPNGSVTCYDTVPSKVVIKIINFTEGSGWFGKEEKRGAVVSHENESIRPWTAEGNFLAWHKTRCRGILAVEQSPAQQRSSQKTKAAKSTFIVFLVPKADWEQFFAYVEGSFWRFHSRTRRERSSYNWKRLPDHSITSTTSI